MRKSRFTEEQIIRAPEQAEAGVKVLDACRQGGITKMTHYRWKSEFDAACGSSDTRR